MPRERLENSLSLHLVFCQVVQDVYNGGCIRITKEQRIRMRGMLGKGFYFSGYLVLCKSEMCVGPTHRGVTRKKLTLIYTLN